jgi:hypothetical protein
MRFAEVNLFGVYVARISVMLVATWIGIVALRLVANRFGLLRHVWHPALFTLAAYVIALSSWILFFAH